MSMLYNNFLHNKDFILETVCGREASDTFKVPRHFQKAPGLKLSELQCSSHGLLFYARVLIKAGILLQNTY